MIRGELYLFSVCANDRAVIVMKGKNMHRRLTAVLAAAAVVISFSAASVYALEESSGDSSRSESRSEENSAVESSSEENSARESSSVESYVPEVSSTEIISSLNSIEESESSDVQSNQNQQVRDGSGDMQRYYFDKNLVNAGLDTGYSDKKEITRDDPHFGWELGKFNLTGYTRVTNEETDNPVFLKNVDDKITLWFKLEQDIDSLDGNDDMSVVDDINGYDQYFGVRHKEFRKGALIIKHSDYQNKDQEPVVYSDYLNTKVNKGANTQVDIFEEGDYEVALDYEIETIRRLLFIETKEYTNYRIFFKFSVRNGNCMVYPVDLITNEELTNKSMTHNGFRLDLAKSRYLDINIKKEVLKQDADGLTEDIRFNAPAKEGDEYFSEGIYTITVKNKYTGQETEKKIYVGENKLLKAYMTTGLSIPEIQKKIDDGAEITDDGNIVIVSKKALSEKDSGSAQISQISKSIPEPLSQPKSTINKESAISSAISDNLLYILIGIGAVPVLASLGILISVYMKSKKKTE